ncbi:MAG: RHS repeat-associated core domain-containing protein [Gemmatimonadales bacterium]
MLAPGGVVVNPKGGGPITVMPSATSATSFSVWNNTAIAQSFSFHCAASGQVTACTPDMSSYSFDAHETIDVSVSFNTGTVGSGIVSLVATGGSSDSGWVDVNVAGISAPTLSRPRQADSVASHSNCLTAGAGIGAFSCGAGLWFLGTPSVTTLDKPRSLTLVHNSATAGLLPIVAANVDLSASNPTLDHVTAVLTVDDTIRQTSRYSPWSSGTKQLALGWDAGNRPTGAYRYTLTVRAVATTDSATSSVSGVLFVVNRRSNPTGAGWEWLGVERLAFDQPRGSGAHHIMWIGGDGSAKLYRQITSARWVAPPEAFRDTIVYASGEYTRTLRHGVQVIYDSTGRHVRTSNRVTQITQFFWGTATRLDSVRVPPTGTGGRTFRMHYNGSGLLDSIRVGSGKDVGVNVSTVGSGLPELLQWRWPDGTWLSPSYTTEGRLSETLDGRSGQTKMVYGNHGLLTQAKQYTGVVGALDSATTFFTPWQTAGFASGGGTQTPGDTATAVTTAEGPRGVGDIAVFHVDQWGATIESKDPFGVKTTFTRGNGLVPALVTEIKYPNSHLAQMTWDSAGNLRTMVDSTWGSRKFPRQITTWLYAASNAPQSPSAMIGTINDTTKYSYTSLGLLDSIIDLRQHTTKYIYAATDDSTRGQIQQVVERRVETWLQNLAADSLRDQTTSINYNSGGNSIKVESPSGGIQRLGRDSDGRIIADTNAVGWVQTFTWDPMDRQTRRIAGRGTTIVSNCIAAEFNCTDKVLDGLNPTGSADTTLATYTDGLLSQLLDPRGVPRSYRYDLRGLMRAEVDQASAVDSAVYDRAGLVTTNRNRLALSVTTAYDAANRSIRTVIPARTQSTMPNSPNAPKDSIATTYDSLGNVLVQHNRWGTIRKTYYENGALRSEVVAPDSSQWLLADSTHYDYDTAGRLQKLTWQNGDSVRYHYAVSGDLDSMRVHLRTNGSPKSLTWKFTWDGLGRRKKITYPAMNTAAIYSYDRIGTLRQVFSYDSLSTVTTNRFNTTWRQDSVDVLGRPISQSVACRTSTSGSPPALPCGDWLPTATDMRYNRLGSLVYQNQLNFSTPVRDTIKYDRSGNRVTLVHNAGGANILSNYLYPSNSNRLPWQRDSLASGGSATVHFYEVDALGAMQQEADSAPGGLPFFRGYQYDAVGRLVGGAHASGSGTNTLYNDCRWDASGRLAKPCDEFTLGFVGNNVVRTGNGWFYVHAPGLDEPLLLVKRNINTWAIDTNGLLQALTDGRGQLIAIADTLGDIDAAYAGSGYDQSTWKGAGLTSRAQTFSPKKWQTGSDWGGVQQFRNRAYDPATGRWLQEDPIGVSGGVNLYQYNGGNPASFSDPFGMSPCSDLRQAIDNNADELLGRKQRYLNHFGKGDADTGHEIQIRQGENTHDNLMRRYRREGCDKENDHDDWDSSSGATRSMFVPAPQVVKTHGWNRLARCATPAVRVAAGLVAVGLLLDDITGAGILNDPQAVAAGMVAICF